MNLERTETKRNQSNRRGLTGKTDESQLLVAAYKPRQTRPLTDTKRKENNFRPSG